jgi:hypothetical protein
MQQSAPMDQAVMPQEHHHHYHYHQQKSGGTAAILEVLPGFFFHTFGIGHIYAGNVAVGLLLLFGGWIALAINLVLCLFLIGFITLPLTWIALMIASPILAAQSCNTR